MKKFAFVIPVFIFLGFMLLSNRLFASGSFNPTLMVIAMPVIFLLLMLVRPKQQKAAKPVSELEAQIRGEFGKDAFADKPELNAKFQAALKDYSGNMPKAALGKLQKLAPACTEKDEKYVVAIAIAMLQLTQGKTVDAIRQYTTALVIHPSAQLSMDQGSCYQRLGELEKARSAYRYALDLDSSFIEARSAIATTYVADRDYETALEEASAVLDVNPDHASALATTAICYGLLNDPVMSKHFADKAEAVGYSRKKITDTISALKK